MTARSARPRIRLNARTVWDLLDRTNVSQNELAQAVGTTSGYLSQLISGKRYPSPRMRRRLQETLGVVRFEDLFIVEDGDGE